RTGPGSRPRARRPRARPHRASGGEDGPGRPLHAPHERRGHVSGAPGGLREALHARVAGGLERLFNPIMLKELRGSLRGLRFFIAHLVILCLFSAGLLLTFLVMIPSRPGGYDDPGDPSMVGRRVYMVTQLLQLAMALLV